MRDYPVPFSAKEETPFIMGISVREMLWLGGGFTLGLLITAVLFSLIKIGAQSMFLALPAIIPSVGLSFFLARKKITEDDHQETLDRHVLKYLQYQLKPHTYLNYRKEG